MNAQPEALRLADALIDANWSEHDWKAADELRRLHQFAEDQIGRATAAEAALQMTKATHALKIAAVEAQRDALLELVVEMDQHEGAEGWSEDLRVKIDAAIKAVEETK